ncbi:MAG: hypothetical protein BGO21_07615 [Dyadobacter sp. 50-39]|uniref:SdrD B-like domain-containing protein n=1 Tax=Dyadobacter sp. 50-39 TaxID=1895756 RepID=UPI00095C2579|nr:SdrD B-like domain-containing protein [Dyadobacter sp. 50-39]OJV17750.1 MAG: hypothetical protein BGO21_07615 [Dyadobacter sp. 50-39]
MKRIWATFCAYLALAIYSIEVFGQVSGLVSCENKPVEAVKISAFQMDANDKAILVGTTYSDQMGRYKFNDIAGGKTRISFEYNLENFLPGMETPPERFVVAPASGIDLNLRTRRAESYYLASAVYISGKGNDGIATLFAVSTDDTVRIKLAGSAEVGCVWGLAFDASRSQLYSSAFAKRHVSYGPLGTGGIYATDWKTKRTRSWINLADFGIMTGQDVHTDFVKSDTLNVDGDFMSQIGKASLGGMDINELESLLCFVNLYDRTLYTIKLSQDTSKSISKSDIMAYPLPSNKDNGIVRPFAVKCYKGEIYVGAVNDASISQNKKDLVAIVYKLNRDTGQLTQLLSLPLSYDRGAAIKGIERKNWNPWTDDFTKALVSDYPSTAVYPQPILSSIAFGREDQIILGLMDRFGHQSGAGLPDPTGRSSYSGVAAGDILIASLAENSRYQLERNASTAVHISEGRGNLQGPSGGEFFYQDSFRAKLSGQQSRVVHEESAIGSVLSINGTGEILSTVHEPENFNSGGVKAFFLADGKTSRSWELYSDGQLGTFGKANGIGCMALIPSEQQLTIGSRVWSDDNGNGLQDPDEMGIDKVGLTIWANGKQIGQTTTNNEGRYQFDTSNVAGGLISGMTYEVRVRSTAQTKVSPFKVGDNAGIDNDAFEMPDFIAASIETNRLTASGYGLDFGLIPVSKVDRPEQNPIIVYPNPVVGEISVTSSEITSIGRLSVISLQGSVLASKELKNDKSKAWTIDMSFLPNGYYILAIDIADKPRTSKVIIKVGK